MTTIQGYIDYQRREYCRDIKCPIQVLLDQESANTDRYEFIREICNNNCLHTTHEFHAWLTDHGFEVVKPKTSTLTHG